MTVDDAATVLGAMGHRRRDRRRNGDRSARHLPAPGEVITIGPFEFEIERVADWAVESLIVTQLQPTPDERRS
jgi:hypothetical protein